MNYEETIKALVDLDVAKWGEAERLASEQMHRSNSPTLGLALNSLAHRPEYDFGDARPDLVALAKASLTPADRYRLAQGG